VARRLAGPQAAPDLRRELEAAVRRLLRLDDAGGAAALLAGASDHIEGWGPGGLVQLVGACLSALPPSATLRGVLLLLRARLHLSQARIAAARADAEEAWAALPRAVEPARLVAYACIR
jgi:ATP/maltotriose-dependent transcriptional regulator MalT